MNEVLTNKSEDLWNPYKELKGIVWKHLNESSQEQSTAELENALKKHKQNFFSLLQNPPKNQKSRDELKKGMVEGINVRGIGHQILSRELYQETVILSDMFELNEYVALDLLCTAQMQMPYYPSLPRGLVAVLLYYDGRKALVSTLLYLVQARNGVQWSVQIKPDVAKFITDYTNQLSEGGLFNRIFELLRTLDLSKEIEKLQQNLALGGPKHRRQVIDMFNDTRNVLAEIVFTWAAQSGLAREPTVALINYLRKVKLEEEASGKIDDVNLYLSLGLLSAMDLSILHSREDGEEAVQLLPIFSDPQYISEIIQELQLSKWEYKELQALSTFGLAVCISSLRDVPQGFNFQDVINKEEEFVDAAIEMNVFTFMHDTLLENKTLYKEPFLFKRIHNLLTDFIFFMYPKVKDLRMKADEIGRTIQIYTREGLEAPANLPRYFEYLLLTVGKFYANDVLNTDYVLSYWSPVDINSSKSYSRTTPRSVPLFKFIRLAGDVLPATLFVPYITMLSGLSSSSQTARHCFNMLKQAGSHISANLSWDHFFMSFSQYYNSLRQETPPQADTVYRSRNAYHKGISPQELEGLHAVLLLMRTIADNDEFSRLALCEHPGWSPLTIMLGLVSCSVPIPLKADLLLTLAVMSKSSENASQMWENLEASQILVTVPSMSSYAPRGIQTEFEEIETRMEEYPLTRAFLKLLDILTNYGIPRMLGAGPRRPGFTPYLRFITNTVFLNYNTIRYRNSGEKWEVATLCLKLFQKFLKQYDPKLSDFEEDEASSAPPGFHLMLQLNNKSELLNNLLGIISEGNRIFDSYVSYPGEEKVRESVLCTFNIIHKALVLQSKFFGLLTTSNSTLLLTHLSKLLLYINHQTGMPDHCVNIAKYVTYYVYLPQHTNIAVKILIDMTASPAIHSQFAGILLSGDNTKEVIRSGFVECLDNPDEDELSENTKKEILKLLQQCLSYSSPNLTHFLMGFDVERDVAKTEFQFPGVLGFPRACLHSIISIMDATVNKSSKSSPSVLESTYQLLAHLTANSKTSLPVLRFIRLNKNFYKDQLREASVNMKNGFSELNQLSWLMNVVAVELKVVSHLKQVTYLKQLTSFLVNVPVEESRSQDMFSLIQKSNLESKIIMPDDIKMESFMSNLLSNFDFTLAPMATLPTLESFNESVVRQILYNSQKKTPPKLYDLKKLHQLLYEELKTYQGTAVIGQIQGLAQEIPKVMKFALERNISKEADQSVIHFVDSWRQVIEVLVTFVPTEIMSSTEQQIVSISLVKQLLKKVQQAKDSLLPEVFRLLSGAVLLIMENLKRWYIRDRKLQNISTVETDMNINIVKLYYGSLKEILESLISWILNSNVVEGEIRINLYATLASFLQLTNFETIDEDLMVNDSLYVSRLDTSMLNTTNKDIRDMPFQLSTDVLSSFGDRLIEVLCHDFMGGQEICKILAMLSFSHLMMVAGNMHWMNHMAVKGYLRHIVHGIFDSDKELKESLEPDDTRAMKPLYLYMAKMLLLCKMAGTKLGSELILEHKLLTVLSNMTVFSCHPEISKTWQMDRILEDFLPSVEQRYLHLWLPTLHICTTILTSLGTDNQSAVAHIMYFLLGNLDVVELVLRSGSPDISEMSLKELALLTSVIARSANNNLVNILENPNIVQNCRAQLYRIQKLMLALLPKFILSNEVVKRLTNNTPQTSDRLSYAIQVIANLLTYSRNIVANHSVDHKGVGVIFTPTLNDPLMDKKTDQEPSLGLIMQQITTTVEYHHQQKATHDSLMRKLEEIPDMNSADLRSYIDDTFELADISVKRERAYEVISEKVHRKKKEIRYCDYIIENALYLIWTHLDFYMLKAIPKMNSYGSQLHNTSLNSDTTLASGSEATWRVSTDMISNVKRGLVSLFNDSFSKQLMETAQNRSESDKEFILALLRKIKRLVQFVPVK